MITEAKHTISARRRSRDRVVTIAINAAGAAILALIVLILGYLLYIALPLSRDASLVNAGVRPLSPSMAFAVSASDGSLWRLAERERSENAPEWKTRSSEDRAILLDGESLELFDLLRRPSSQVSEANRSGVLRRMLEVPGIRPQTLVFQSAGDQALIVYRDDRDALHAQLLTKLGSAGEAELQHYTLTAPPLGIGELLVDAERGQVINVSGRRYFHWQLPLVDRSPGATLHAGTLEGLPASLNGALVAWGPAQETLLLVDPEGWLHRFDSARLSLPRLGPPVQVVEDVIGVWSETRRRVVHLVNSEAVLQVVAPAGGQVLYEGSLSGLQAPGRISVSDDGATLSLLNADSLRQWTLHNPFPEAGWRSLWTAQHYGAYAQPVLAWHPDGDAIGVLSKYGLTPLIFGTFKAAVYGLLLSVPLALGAAIYTGYFLSPRRRNQFKPAIEMLEAFPTVVLGFIAGLWLAPILLDYLALIFILPLLVLGLPLLLALAHLVLQYLSPRFVRRPPRIGLLIAAYLIAGIFLAAYIEPIQEWLFTGSARDWLWQRFGLRYEQRNALLVGLAMGVAITPAMFSIIEDAVFAVPRGLSDGSLALGATRWQSLALVVLPAASPAILSAILIGLARGLGETMIILLATGNTPLMEAGMFSGLRSLSASIALELPEAGADGMHFRILFLAALVLFGLTFVLNTIAELFRQRLRYAYSSH